MRVLLLAASAYALDALHALLDSHPRGLRKVAVAHTSYGRGLVATCAMFYKATSFNQALDKWNVSNVTNMRWMLDADRPSDSLWDRSGVG